MTGAISGNDAILQTIRNYCGQTEPNTLNSEIFFSKNIQSETRTARRTWWCAQDL